MKSSMTRLIVTNRTSASVARHDRNSVRCNGDLPPDVQHPRAPPFVDVAPYGPGFAVGSAEAAPFSKCGHGSLQEALCSELPNTSRLRILASLPDVPIVSRDRLSPKKKLKIMEEDLAEPELFAPMAFERVRPAHFMGACRILAADESLATQASREAQC